MYEIFTLGGGTYLVDLLNAVAAITGAGAFITLAQIAGVAGLAWALFRTAFGGSWKDNARWLLLFVAVWGAMVVPKATVRVVDRLDPALAPAVVADVPIGLALFASLTSQVGDGLTRLTEQAFSLPNDLTYRRHGLIFGARLAAAATRMEVTDAVFARNLRAYARQCVFHALLLGHISADDLRESTDVWRLVTAAGSPSAGASPARMVEYATRGASSGTGATTVDREIVTCAVAASRLNALWSAEIARASGIFGRRLFPGARTEALARAELMAALPAAHSYLIGASRTAAEILRQQMVLNAVHEAGEQWTSEAGNAAALRAYTEARAETQTVSAYRAIGRQAETWVPMLRIVFECLYVGAFPMAVLLMLTPAGAGIFRSYLAGLVWLQSWGPLYAVLHRISMGEAAERMSAGALMPGGDAGVSLVAQAGIQAVASDVAVMAGYLSMSVPFLAAALAYGVGRATALATSVLAVGQEAASSAAQEGTTGNVSLANTVADTHRFATVEGNQVRTSLHADTDRYTGFSPEGAAFTVTGDGTAVADAGPATSRVPAAGIRLSESLAASHESRAGAAREAARHWSAEAAVARTAAATDSAAMVERFSRDVNTGVAHSRGVTESESQRVQSLESHYERLSEAGGITKEQAAALTSEAKAGGGFNFVVKFGVDGSVSWRGHTLSREAWNRMTDYAEQNSVLDTWSRVAEASRRYSAASGESELTSLEESFSANLAQMRRFGEQEALSHREAQSWSDQAAEVRSHGQAIDRELGQPFFNWLSSRSGADGREIGVAGAMRLASPQTPEDAEELRGHAAAFIAERFPAPKGPDPASAPDLAAYGRTLEGLQESHGSRPAAAWAEWSGWARDHGRGGGEYGRGSVGRRAGRLRAETDTELDIREAEREVRGGVAGERSEQGRARVAAETDRPFGEHAAESVPLVGEWLGGKLYGTAGNAAPDAGGKKDRERGGPMGGDEVLGP